MEKITDEKHYVKALFKEANRWHHAQTIRLYINHFEEKAVTNKSLTEDMEEYIKWVNHIIEWYDPMINTPAKYLDEAFKEELQKPKVEKQSNKQYNQNYWGKSHWESHW